MKQEDKILDIKISILGTIIRCLQVILLLIYLAIAIITTLHRI